MLNPNANVYNNYRNTAVQTASPGKLLLMLYDGLIVFLKRAKEDLNNKNNAEAHTKLIKAQDIFTELMCTLNMDYEISHNLFQLYDYLKQRLVEANVSKDEQIIDEVLSFAQELRQTWAQVVGSEPGGLPVKS